MRSALSFILLFLAFEIQAQFADTVALVSSDHKNISTYFHYYIDSTKELALKNIKQLPQEEFESIDASALRLDLIDANIWLTLAVKNQLPSEEEFIIEFDDPSLYDITLYKRKSDVSKVERSGTSVHPEDKEPPGNKNNFKISLKPNQVVQLAFKINSKTSMTLSATIKPEESAEEEYLDQSVWLGAYYAVLILLFFYALFLFGTTKIKAFLLYAFYLMCVGMFTAAADGFISKYLHPIVILLNGYHDIFFFTLSNVLGLAFMLVFLNVKKWAPKVAQLINWYAIILPITISTFFIISKPLMLAIVQMFGLITPAIYIIIGLWAVKNKIDQALYYLIAYLTFGIFVLVFTLSMYRVIPFSPLVQYSIHVGYFFSIIILSYGLIQRVYRVYEKFLDKEKEKKQIIFQKNKELEIKVAERTEAIAKKEINLRSILDNTVDSIWLIDAEYKLIDFNKVFADSWHAAFGTHLAYEKNILELNPIKEDRDKWKKRYDESLAGQNAVYIDTYKFDNRTHYFEVRGFPIRENNRVKGVAYFAKDITPRLQAEKQLKTQNEMLKKVNKELDSFVYSASHDLKAPLASVLGLINLVRNEKDLSQRHEYYGMMEKSIVRLDTFIKDIIDYSRNERTEIKRKKIDFDELLSDVFQDLQYLNGSEEIQREIAITNDSTFKSDPVRTRVIIRNLVSNAIKYGCHEKTKNKKITVNIAVTESQAKIEVIDYGYGIGEKHLPHVFKMFYRAQEQSAGTGLGLYIVKETVEKLNGNIEVYSKPEQGTRFIVTIPNSKR